MAESDLRVIVMEEDFKVNVLSEWQPGRAAHGPINCAIGVQPIGTAK